jgi:Ran-binding protein 1
MADAAKPDPAAEQVAAPGATLQKDETAKVTTDVTDSKPAEDKPASSVTETVSNAASTATSAVKDNVFSMFGGGPKKEKKEDADDADEPSGATKKAEVSDPNCVYNLN